MNTLIFLGLLEETADAATSSGPSMLIPVLGMAAIFYFLVIAPDRKQRKQAQTMRDELKKGDKVLSVGGIYGTIRKVDDNKIHVLVDDKVCMVFSRPSIQGVVDKDGHLVGATPAKGGAKAAKAAKEDPKQDSKEDAKEEPKQIEAAAATQDEKPKRVVSER